MKITGHFESFSTVCLALKFWFFEKYGFLVESTKI